MVVYACQCLNVRIFAEKPERDAEADALETCPLGPACEAVELVNQGFQFAHKRLVQRLREGDWTIYVCVPCHMRTHGVNSEDRLVVINADMNKGEETVSAMLKSPEYSPAFKLVLKQSEGRRVEDGSIPRQSYDTLQKQLGDLQVILSCYLKKEEEAMESRIRRYEEEQRNNFLKLKKQTQQEKTKLVSVLFQKSEGNDAMGESDRAGMRRHMTISHSKSSGEYEKSTPQVAVSRKSNRRIRDSSPDVFAMDGLDLEDDAIEGEPRVTTASGRGPSSSGFAPPPPASGARWRRGDSANFLDTMEEVGGGGGGGRGFAGDDDDDDFYNGSGSRSSAAHMSTSVPISMPFSARNIRNMGHHLEDEIDEDLSAEFDDIPRQMQALSESIQERDRYIFGDRPRQRVNTGDFTQVKWN